MSESNSPRSCHPDMCHLWHICRFLRVFLWRVLAVPPSPTSRANSAKASGGQTLEGRDADRMLWQLMGASFSEGHGRYRPSLLMNTPQMLLNGVASLISRVKKQINIMQRLQKRIDTLRRQVRAPTVVFVTLALRLTFALTDGGRQRLLAKADGKAESCDLPAVTVTTAQQRAP